MIALEKYGVFNLENAVRGARNPMNSWKFSDSYMGKGFEVGYIIGPKDMELLTKLCHAGPDHRKFMRQIFVSVDITAPLYLWKEFDTYKVGTTGNSCSTMHKIHTKPFELSDFSTDKMDNEMLVIMSIVCEKLEYNRLKFIQTKDKQYWWNLIQLLPSSYNQMRTCTMSYETLRAMYFARSSHKLDEWREFCSWMEKLPYAKELLFSK